MKKILIAFSGVALACALSACSSTELKAHQKNERHTLSEKQQADRQVERAQKIFEVSTASTAVASANLTAKKLAQAKANTTYQELFCPQPKPVPSE